jgi:uncharacterized protein (TIGR02217 family)
MAFLEEQLDPLITKGAKSTIEWKRTKVYAHSGRLRQNFDWSTAKHVLDLSYRARPAAQYEALRDFFMVVMSGAYEGFRAKDWSNYELTQDNSSLVLVSGATYQIHRRHAVGVIEYLHPIKKPTGTITVIRNRASVISVASASVDETTGIATIGGHIEGDTYTAEGEYDTPVTFADDEWVTNLEVSTADLWLSPEPIRLEEITRSLA